MPNGGGGGRRLSAAPSSAALQAFCMIRVAQIVTAQIVSRALLLVRARARARARGQLRLLFPRLDVGASVEDRDGRARHSARAHTRAL
jgi:hypothetical protein